MPTSPCTAWPACHDCPTLERPGEPARVPPFSPCAETPKAVRIAQALDRSGLGLGRDGELRVRLPTDPAWASPTGPTLAEVLHGAPANDERSAA